jgi:hypothetical protein
MPLAPAYERRTRSHAVPDRVFLHCDDKGCTLSAPDTERRFPDLQKALDCARHSRDLDAATIEIWQGGQYICCVAPRSWQRQDNASSVAAPRLVSESRLAAAERHANRAARILLATAGPLFWLAMVALLVAASLGWRMLLL